MENSIENIWKQGFLNESSLVAPKVNDLYNQKSIHVVDRIKLKMKQNRKFILIAAFVIPIMWCSIGAIWEGLAISFVFLFRLWYAKQVRNNTQILDQGATSYDYIKSFDTWLKDILSKNEIVARVTNTLVVPLAMSATWTAWSKAGVILKWTQKHPDLNIPLIAIIITVMLTIPAFYFSAKINKFDIRLVYGRLFDRLEETIADMEKLKQGE